MVSIRMESLGEAELEQVRSGMRRAIERHVAFEAYTELSITARAPDGRLLGAAFGEAGRGWLHVSLMWVDEGERRRGHGTGLLRALESEATARGCHAAYLDTFSYQARPFCERFGYRVFGVLDDYPIGHERYFMRKELTS